MSDTLTQEGEFSLAEARDLVRDLFEPNPRIYWTDLLLSAIGGHLSFVAVRALAEGLILNRAAELPAYMPESEPLRWALLVVAFLTCCLLFYRAGTFIHELVHLRSGSFRWFRLAYNGLCGIPFLMPSFVYLTHVDHHRRKHYGTEADGEYLPLSHWPTRYIVFYLLEAFVVPPLAFLRFLVFTPISWVFPAFRRWMHQRASSMIIDPRYLRPLPTAEDRNLIRRQEVFCFLYLMILVFGVWWWQGYFPAALLAQAYLTGVTIVLINGVRTVSAHRWTNDGHSEMTFVDQMLDSVNVPGNDWFNALWGPLGMRFHALHHLFPSMPYHNMPAAHRRLMEKLPEDSPYRRTNEPSLFAAFAKLWRRTRQGSGRPAASEQLSA